MPQYTEEIQQFGNRYTDFVLDEVKGMRAMLVKLKSEGYKLYGLTNWCSQVHVTMEQYPIFQLLDGRVISSEEHLVKPSIAIYERLCSKFGLKADECVFTDDNANVEAARKMGMKGICFSNAMQFDACCHAMLLILFYVVASIRMADGPKCGKEFSENLPAKRQGARVRIFPGGGRSCPSPGEGRSSTS